ncbi:MAG TPA: hypothetical protein VF089_19305 [Candidatus Binatia bacterium]
MLQPYSDAAQELEQAAHTGYRGGKWQTMAIGQTHIMVMYK